jgi:hypothetical protein
LGRFRKTKIKVMNRIQAGTHIVAMKPTRIVRRRRVVQAYYGSARSNGSRLPFLLEPPATATVLASMVSSHTPVAARDGSTTLNSPGKAGLARALPDSITHPASNSQSFRIILRFSRWAVCARISVTQLRQPAAPEISFPICLQASGFETHIC